MPELPEVETLKNYLELRLIGTIIDNAKILRREIRAISNELEQIQKAQIVSFKRRAKYLLIELDNCCSVIIHLGMTGKLTIRAEHYLPSSHDHVIFYLDNKQQLVFNDYRRFGMIYLVKNDAENILFNNLGIEPLSSDITPQYLTRKLTIRKVPIKNLLMDNKIIVGIGNIYASESLFAAKIHPSRLGVHLLEEEINNLLVSIQTVLKKAILAGGTTIKDFVSADNKPGYFQQELHVYGREGKPCFICKELIKRIIHAGRATFYCINCQK